MLDRRRNIFFFWNSLAMAILSRQISTLTSSSKLKKTSSLALLLIASSARAFGTTGNLLGHSIVDSAAAAPRGPARGTLPSFAAFGSYGSPTRFGSCSLHSAIASIRGGSSARFSSTLEELSVDSMDVVKETASRMSAAEKLERIRARMAECGVDGASSNDSLHLLWCDRSI